MVKSLVDIEEPPLPTSEAVGSEADGARSSKGTMLLAVLLAAAVAVLGWILASGSSPDDSAEPNAVQDCLVLGAEDCESVLASELEAPFALRDLLWEEEFDQLDPGVWEVEHSSFGDGNNELQCYTPDQVSVESGSLVLTAINQSAQCPTGGVRAQVSGMVRTQAFTLSPGQAIEWRVKLTPADEANQGGLWPAVWASSWAGGSWPRGGEWDGFEVMTANSPDRVSYGIHFSDTAGEHDKRSREVFGERFSDDWHEFRFDYGLHGTLVWYMDGVETYRVNDAPTLQGYPAPFDQTMTELRINLALGGNPGPLDARALPATLRVDYIRAWSLSE